MNKALNSLEKVSVLHTNYIGNLGYVLHNQNFITPITYFYNEEKHNITCHLHNKDKINALRKKNPISLYVSDINSFDHRESVLIKGTYKEHNGSGAKAILHEFSLGIKKIIINEKQKDLDFMNQFSDKSYANDIPVIFTIEIEEITGKCS
tara:strand:+ start:1267 stop:1716 length:450 start_codon:yes stop_codon:yes gene_type:complete